MNLNLIGRAAGALVLTAGLAGCMDVTMEVEILSETNGKATTTMVMASDIYAIAKAGMAGEEAGADDFCSEEGSVLTENADGSATCVMVEEGSFADLKVGEDGGVKIEAVSPGVVRISFSTKDMKSEIGGGEAEDAQSQAMMAALFEGRNITMRVKGKEILESNMTIGADKTTAETVIPFTDLLSGTADVPDEIYATVKTN